MAKLLYITCNLNRIEHSLSLAAGSEFLEDYQRCNPGDEIHFLDLYRDNIQRIDADVLSGWEKLAAGENYAALNAEEQRKLGRIWRLADQFLALDKYVFVTPMWNFGFPAEFKMYIDTICVVDKTYRLTDRGPEAVLAGKRRKSLHLHAAGALSVGADHFCVPYLSSVLDFLGVKDQETVVLEGSDIPGQGSPESLRKVRSRLLELAVRF
jgi:FMN-dependent NADH-azoreductase